MTSSLKLLVATIGVAFLLLAGCSSSDDSEPAPETMNPGESETPLPSGDDTPSPSDDDDLPPPADDDAPPPADDDAPPPADDDAPPPADDDAPPPADDDETPSSDIPQGSLDAPAGSVDFVGTVVAATDSTANTGKLSATFFELDSLTSIQALEDSIDSLALDMCKVTSVSVDSPQVPALPDFSNIDLPGKTVSAGEVVGIRTSAGNSYAELPRDTENDFIFYTTDSVLDAGALPAGLLMDVPGDVFPVFEGVPLPDNEPFSMTSPIQGNPISADTLFTWTPSATEGAIVRISFQTFNLATQQAIGVACVANDDGSFAFPPDTQEAMGSSSIGLPNPAGFDARRGITRFIKVGNVLFVMENSSKQ